MGLGPNFQISMCIVTAVGSGFGFLSRTSALCTFIAVYKAGRRIKSWGGGGKGQKVRKRGGCGRGPHMSPPAPARMSPPAPARMSPPAPARGYGGAL